MHFLFVSWVSLVFYISYFYESYLVQEDESREQQMSNSDNDLLNLVSGGRSPKENHPKKVKKRKGQKRRKSKKLQKDKHKKVKRNRKTQKKKSSYSKKKNNVASYESNQKYNSRKVKSERITKIDPMKVKIIKKMNNKRRARPGKYQRQTGPDDTTCLANIGLAMDYLGKPIKFFKNQRKRIEKFEDLIKKKSGKKNDFEKTTVYMYRALGSDNSCSGATDKM